MRDEVPLFDMVEFSLTELCNRTCNFCPRYDAKVYPNRDLHMDFGLYKKIICELGDIGYQDVIVYSGFGEPLLYKNIFEAIQLAREKCPEARIDLKTNGDFLNVENMKKLFEKGLSLLHISLYDGSQFIEKFEDMIEKAGLDEEHVKLRVRFLHEEEKYGLIISNRGGMVNKEVCPPLETPMNNCCYYPFYTFFIDFDGKVLLCPHDWGKKLVLADANNETLVEIWNSDKMNEIRARLNIRDRDFGPCDVCNVNGTMYGQKKYEAWQLYMAKKNEKMEEYPIQI